MFFYLFCERIWCLEVETERKALYKDPYTHEMNFEL